jgi:hypothetical protein
MIDGQFTKIKEAPFTGKRSNDKNKVLITRITLRVISGYITPHHHYYQKL